jgi:hypothetical protein
LGKGAVRVPTAASLTIFPSASPRSSAGFEVKWWASFEIRKLLSPAFDAEVATIE